MRDAQTRPPIAGTYFKGLPIKLFCFLPVLAKTNVLNLGIAENGFVKTEKSWGEQVIKNSVHVTPNVAMKPCSYVIRI
jgi:hypothetical protein